jgi:hypothetical protein
MRRESGISLAILLSSNCFDTNPTELFCAVFAGIINGEEKKRVTA